jgi:hypothetical protein
VRLLKLKLEYGPMGRSLMHLTSSPAWKMHSSPMLHNANIYYSHPGAPQLPTCSPTRFPIFLALTIYLFGFNISVPSNVVGFFHRRMGYRLEHLPATIRRANRNNMVPGQSARGLGYAVDEPAEQRGRHHTDGDDNRCVASSPLLFC